jgi:AraC family transcriptional regulator, regulatory protein of adaptative response / methylated-DNA-[protein]-cysteine methyltransferase
MIAVASETGICLLEFLNRRAAPRTAGRSPIIRRLRAELDAYFREKLRRFESPLDLRGTPFQRAVWRRLSRVPYGRTLTYAELARRAGRPSAVRAAGHANGCNPVSIVIPCHRVVGTDGALHGYGGGLWRKQWLIAHERGESPRKFSRAGSSPRSSKRSRPATRSGP